MIERKDVMPVNFLKKENFTGSDTGMRYRMEKASKEEETVLKVTVWPEPYGYDATPPEQKTSEYFPFTEEGIVSGVAYTRFLRSPQKTGADFRQEHGIMTAEYWVNLELTRQGK